MLNQYALSHSLITQEHEMKTFDVKNKIALVTGSNRGIGRAFVEELVARGAKKVYAAVRDSSRFAEMKSIAPDVVEPILLDVTRMEDVREAQKTIAELDLLVNNAGVINPSLCGVENAAEISRIEMETNFFGTVQITLALLPMLKHSRGALVNISSIAGISNFLSIGPYSASKAAVHSYTQGLRTELAKDGVLVTGVYPGPIETRMTEQMQLDKAPPSQVAQRTLDGLAQGLTDVFPDSFSEAMFDTFLQSPAALEQAFAQMHQ